MLGKILIEFVEFFCLVAANAWMETLLSATEFLPLDIVKNNIFSIALNKGQISQNVNHRIAACKLLGKISSRIETPMCVF